MRSDRDFTKGYKTCLMASEPAARELAANTLHALARTELCLTALNAILPNTPITVVPSLMLGYPALVAPDTHGTETRYILASLRHLCSQYTSLSAWIEACRAYVQHPETLRCFDIRNDQAIQRASASTVTLDYLSNTLRQRVPWSQRVLTQATPGQALVSLGNGRSQVLYQIPELPRQTEQVKQHALRTRTESEPIQVSLSTMKMIARQIDQREAEPDWPENLPPLHLATRLENTVHLERLAPGFFDGDLLTLDGNNHVVGMLSSGKSTLVMGLLFALTKGTLDKRVAVIAGDTLQAAALAARLQKHGIKTSVFSSQKNREHHLNALLWRQGQSATHWQLSASGTLAGNFSTACPLEGFQPENPPVVSGETPRQAFPGFDEKPCHALYPVRLDAASSQNAQKAKQREQAVSCPLWPECPATAPQRDAADARVLIMTPQALVHMSPDKWTTEHALSLPELLQFAVDLVIVDEADAVQKTLDDMFAPRDEIMGSNRTAYMLWATENTSASLRKKSGHQYGNPTLGRWLNNLVTFNRLVNFIYAMLQNEKHSLRPVYRNEHFTGCSVLYQLWKDKHRALGHTLSSHDHDNGFQQIIQVASAIPRYSQYSNLDDDPANRAPLSLDDPSLQDATLALQEIAREVLLASYYTDLLSLVETRLTQRLNAFCVLSAPELEQRTSPGTPAAEKTALDLKQRTNVLMLLLAVTSELALSHYNWLIKAQPAVADDLSLNDATQMIGIRNLSKHYRTLIPTNPSGTIFGFLYDEPEPEKAHEIGGTLFVVMHLGVGRHLLTQLHELLHAEGQAGPAVLLLSGTSWAGGKHLSHEQDSARWIDTSSPVFDVQVPVKGVLTQPQAELEAVRKSCFDLVSLHTASGQPIAVSGTPTTVRHKNLELITDQLITPNDGLNMIERYWTRLARTWGDNELDDRKRVLLVVNSYADAAVVASALSNRIRANGLSDWHVFCLVPDAQDSTGASNTARISAPANTSGSYRQLPRSLIETFGREKEKSILVAPIRMVSRGHNILNSRHKAAISAIYFLHRPHPRPDDFSSTIGRINRFATTCFNHGFGAHDSMESIESRARRMRFTAIGILRRSLDFRGGYSSLPPDYKAQFAWDMLAELWQTIGRGIRGGSPVFVGFVDYKFAPRSFDWQPGDPLDTGNTSALVNALEQLALAMNPEHNPYDHRVARLLYEPFYQALCQTGGLRHAHHP